MDTIPNPHFPADASALRDARARLEAAPPGLPRPLLVIGGYRSPRMMVAPLLRRLKRFAKARDGEITVVTSPLAPSVHEAGDRVRAVLESDGRADAEHDVVGISMGGLVARALAAGLLNPSGVLRVRRLFTLATPHRGADAARVVAPDAAAIAMVPGSALLESLDRAFPHRSYELVCYSYLRDWWVGTENTSPEGIGQHWIDPADPASRLLAHFSITRSEVIAIDLALRLKGLAPLSTVGTEPPRVGPFTPARAVAVDRSASGRVQSR